MPDEADRREAIRSLLAGLRQGTEVPDLALSVEPLHPRDNTFPGEVFMEVAVEAIDMADVQPRGLPYEELLTRFLAECEFRGRRSQKIRFAILATGAARGGIDPDLLDEIIWWRTDDFWFYALAASVAIIRACSDKRSRPIGEFVVDLGNRLGIELGGLPT
jgi:hypothetical protein